MIGRRWLHAVSIGVVLALGGGCAGADGSPQPRAGAEPASGEVPLASSEKGRPPAPSPTTTTPPPPSRVALQLDNYTIEPGAFTTSEGAVTVAADNVDGVPHDVVLLRTDLPPDRLPTTGIRVDEASPALSILGRTPRLAAGQSGDFTVGLTQGTYILVCTVPHHYVREAMVSILTVTD